MVDPGFLGGGGGGGGGADSQAHRTQRWLAAYCHESRAPSSFSVTIHRYAEYI